MSLYIRVARAWVDGERKDKGTIITCNQQSDTICKLIFPRIRVLNELNGFIWSIFAIMFLTQKSPRNDAIRMSKNQAKICNIACKYHCLEIHEYHSKTATTTAGFINGINYDQLCWEKWILIRIPSKLVAIDGNKFPSNSNQNKTVFMQEYELNMATTKQWQFCLDIYMLIAACHVCCC